MWANRPQVTYYDQSDFRILIASLDQSMPMLDK